MKRSVRVTLSLDRERVDQPLEHQVIVAGDQRQSAARGYLHPADRLHPAAGHIVKLHRGRLGGAGRHENDGCTSMVIEDQERRRLGA